MVLETRIWQETIEAAKAAAFSAPGWVRAIERAVIEIERSPYWGFADGVLTIISTTSKKTYRVGEGHTCTARSRCKHRAARRLMQRYLERFSASPVQGEGERGRLIARNRPRL